MKISVVISVYNEEKMLPDCLSSLARQTSPAYEVVIIDNNSTDRSAEIAREYGVRVVKEKKQGIWAARHTGFTAAKGDVIVCTDADARFPEVWLHNIAAEFHNKEVIAVSGSGEFYDGSKVANMIGGWLYMKPYFFLTQLALTTKPLFGSNFAVRKSVWQKVKNEVHSDREDIFDDLDLTHHILPYGKIVYSEDCKNYISIRPLKSPLGMVKRYVKGVRSFYIHWPQQSPRKLWQKKWGL